MSQGSTSPAAPPRASVVPFAILLALASVLTVPLVVLRAGGTSEYADMVMFHRPIIERMRAEWPRVDIVHYASATTPGYHLLMAALWQWTGRPSAMFAANTTMGILLIGAVYLAARRFSRPWGALALTLPLACSPYILGASIWLTTDNAAMLFVVLALGAATIARSGHARLLAGGIAAGLAVSMRQLHVWLAAPLGFAGLIASPLSVLVPRILRWGESDPLSPRDRSMVSLAIGCVAAAIPALVLLYFVWQWGWQLTPVTSDPEILKHNKGPNLAAPAFALALTGALGVFFVPLCWARLRALRPADVSAWAAAAAGLAAALAFPTSYLWTETWMPRAYGWLWRIVEKFPAPMERSIVIAAAAPVGALIILLLYRAACDAGRRVPAGVLLLSMLGWLAAQTMNSMAWQRYFEPMILLMLIWLGAMTRGTDSGLAESVYSKGAPAPIPQGRNRWHVTGLLALAACQMGLSAITLYREAIGSLSK